MMLLGTVLLSAAALVVARNGVIVPQSNLRQLQASSDPNAPAMRDGLLMADLDGDKCTTIVVGPKAGIEGPMTTHTSDCGDCDFRVNKVPAKDWPKGSTRPLYMYRDQYPVLVSPHRGATWEPKNLQGNEAQLEAWGKESPSTGSIPQVEHTYALYEGGYGIMNEYQVAIGESTCASRFYGTPVTAGGKAQIEVAEMTRIALERSQTARETIQLMGDLATELGFYAADWRGGDMSKGEGGEGLTVIDKTEAWVFHVLADDTGTSAVWAAQRLKPDHVAVIANSFIIREIDPDSDDFMHSTNMYDVAERNGLWSKASGKKLDFLPTFAPKRSHPEYSTRRQWRVLSQVAPSLNLPGETDAYANDYPFSVKAERILTPEDLMAFNRDHYEGTPYDLTQGLAAGPYGDPNRFDGALNDNMTIIDLLNGGYERAISMFRTSYSFVAQSRPGVPDSMARIWYGQYNPSSCSYAPFYVSAEHIPQAYTRGSLGQGYDNNIAFWNFLAVGNYAGRLYKFAMQEVKRTQDSIHAAIVQDATALEKDLLALQKADEKGEKKKEVVEKLTDFTNTKGEFIMSEWRSLLPRLITTYHDGMIAMDLDKPTITMKRLFYPKWWLQATGYFLHHGNFGPDTILFQPSPDTVAAPTMSYGTAVLFTAVLSSIATVVGTLYVLKLKDKRHEYAPIQSNGY